jgi:hypothetical protein
MPGALDPSVNLGSISSGTGLPPGISAKSLREGSDTSNEGPTQLQATGTIHPGDRRWGGTAQADSRSTAADSTSPNTEQHHNLIDRGLKVIQEEGEGESSGQGTSSGSGGSSGRGSANGAVGGSGSNMVRTTSGKTPLLVPLLSGLGQPLHAQGLDQPASGNDHSGSRVLPESEDTPRAHRPMRSGPPGTSPAVLHLGTGDSPPQGHEAQRPGAHAHAFSPARPSPLGLQRISSFETVSRGSLGYP